MTPSIIEILKYFGLDIKIVKSLSQGEILYLIRKYYFEIKS